jgi:hypothetical protein
MSACTRPWWPPSTAEVRPRPDRPHRVPAGRGRYRDATLVGVAVLLAVTVLAAGVGSFRILRAGRPGAAA